MFQPSARGQFGPDGLRRPWVRAVVAVGAVALLLGGMAGVTAAKGKGDNGDEFDKAATNYVIAEVDAGAQELELLKIGDVTVSVNCQASSGWGSEYPWGIGMTGEMGATNNGLNPVAIALGDQTWWLGPGDTHPVVFGGGQWVNEDHPDGMGLAQVVPFAILDHGDTSATGLIASSARVHSGDPDVPGDEFGECVFTIQAKG